MENSKGSEYKNITDTWDENEKKRAEANAGGTGIQEEPAASELDQIIKQEAAEYDNENKENRILAGDRATVNDAQEDVSDE